MLIWILVAVNLFIYPAAAAVDVPAEADAVVVLAGASSERLPVGLALVRDGHAPVLVLSTTSTPGNQETDALCAAASPKIICFSPEPMTTRGEARAVARLARNHGWDSIIVVTSRYHVTRADLNLDQCNRAKITMVASEPDFGAGEWLGRLVEETGGVGAGLLRPACANPVSDPHRSTAPTAGA